MNTAITSNMYLRFFHRQCLINYAYPEHCNLFWQSETIISLSSLIVYYSYLIV